MHRWKATAIRQGDWADWFQVQMKTANKKPEKGLYVSLRMDGRVRGSGVGSPPWDRLAVALPPVSGASSILVILLELVVQSLSVQVQPGLDRGATAADKFWQTTYRCAALVEQLVLLLD